MNREALHHDVRQRLVRLPAPYQAHYGVVPAPPPEHGIMLGEAARGHANALAALAKADQLAQTLADPFLLSRLLPRREAVSSSAIENTHSTLDELLSTEEDADEQTHEAALQVRDYALTLDRHTDQARKTGTDLFTPDLVASLHADAMAHDPRYADKPGELRQRVVWIGGTRFDIAYSTFNPPPPDRVGEGLADNLAYLRGEGMQVMTQSIVTRMAVAHAHFEAVHPFPDGNGRVGRLLLPLMMAAEGHVSLYLSPYIEAHRSAYYDALRLAQQRLDWAAATAFMAAAIVGTFDELMATRAALSGLADAWRERRRFRVGSAALRALGLLLDYPIITASRLAARLNLSFPAANTAIDQLAAIGILTERTGYSRNRVFAATEVLAIVNRPFGAPPARGGENGA